MNGNQKNMMEHKTYEFDGIIYETPENGGAYVIFPWDIREEFGKGRVKVYAQFDGLLYEGSIPSLPFMSHFRGSP